MLCEICSNIDLDQARSGQYKPDGKLRDWEDEYYMQHFNLAAAAEGYQHHANFAALCESAASGCQLCNAIVSLSIDPKWIRGESQLILKMARVGDSTGFWVGEIAQFNDDNPTGVVVAELGVYSTTGKTWLPEPPAHSTLTYSVESDEVFQGRFVPAEADITACMTRAKGWLTACLRNHEACREPEIATLPTRVLDVGTDSDSTIRLHQSHGESGFWVALTHRWGNSQIITTRTSNIDAHIEGLLFAALPKTFQDAIIITRQLGMRYLWIDSLCIIQDSQDDWIHESAKMGNIYKNAVVTIAAGHPNSQDGGIFAERTSIRHDKRFKEPVQVYCHAPSLGETKCLYVREPLQRLDDIVDTKHFNPLQKRGWVLQETVLSRRTIHWTQEQMIWVCRKHAEIESADVQIATGVHAYEWVNGKTAFLPPVVGMSKDANSALYNTWLGFVVDFCARQITYINDIFPALSALAQEMHSLTGDVYMAGLWKEDVHRGLLWSRAREFKLEIDSYRAPSWSWASGYYNEVGEGESPYFYIIPSKQVRKIRETDLEVLDVDIVPATSDPYGRLLSGRLKVQGWVSTPTYTPPSTFSSDDEGSESYSSEPAENDVDITEEMLLQQIGADIEFSTAVSEEAHLNFTDRDTGVTYSFDHKAHLSTFLAMNTICKTGFLLLAVAKLEDDDDEEAFRFTDTSIVSGLILYQSSTDPEAYIRIGLVDIEIASLQRGNCVWEKRPVVLV